MSFPLGVFPAFPGGPSENASFTSSFRSFRGVRGEKSAKGDPPSNESRNESVASKGGSVRKEQSPKKSKTSKKHQKSLSSKVLGASKRLRAGSSPINSAQKASIYERPGSTPLLGAQSPPDQAYELSASPPGSLSRSRPKHVPIVIPNYVPIASDTSESRSGSVSTWPSSDSDPPLSAQDFLVSANRASTGIQRSKPRHVEIKIPHWAQPVLKQPETPPRVNLSRSIFFDTFADIAALSPPDMSRPTPDSSRASTMNSAISAPSPDRANASFGPQGYLASANSSQSSLVGRRDEYESASEAESTHTEEDPSSHTPNQNTGGPNVAAPHNTPSTNPANLSGLVCNVHRTTGKEPHPLVGATTTILGDKLYVFGGRRLSRSKPQLTSNLYELDLIRRHWTKLHSKGDIPPPRYFHSVCSLGDGKLVCYGGMSPAPASPEMTAEAPPEVVVMSDIHIYDVPTKTWMKINVQDSPQGRYAHCAAVLPSSAVFSSVNAPMSAVHHNPSSGNPNQGSLGVALDGTGGAEMVVVGGQDSANHYIEQVSVFNLRSLKWTGTTSMGRSCGAYRSVVTPLTTMIASQIGAGPHARADMDEDEDEPATIGSGAPMLIYSNYNFLDVKLELQVRLTDGSLTEKTMQTTVSPPGLRFPNGGVIANHFVVSGTFLTSSKQEYALWALDLRTLTWSRIDAGGSIFSQGSWNRGVLWSRRNAFVILGNRKRSLVDDYNNRRINFSNICLVELEAFGLYDNPRKAGPMSDYMSASSAVTHAAIDTSASGRQLSQAAEELGNLSMNVRELADMEFLALDGTRIPVNSRLIARRWGAHFITLLRESLVLAAETETSTLRPSISGNETRNSTITITPSVNSTGTTLTTNTATELPDARSAPPSTRPRLFYLPHTAQTLHALLHYLYTSTLPSPPHPLATPQTFCSLLQLARPYKIDGLLEAVVECLHESLDGRNAAAIFNAAAMAAGGGDGVKFAPAASNRRDSSIPLRTASLAGLDSMVNGAARGTATLRIDTDVANRRSTRNTLRPGQRLVEDSEDEVPNSAATDASMSDLEGNLSPRAAKDREVWTGAVSAVVGLQKRGLRGLMEGRRMRERGKSDGAELRVGFGIA
ncbi:hypothetical protein LTR37_003989 [Vermiconidia calcicola]|uniref:Uncharacterized protein n=1 Tax=Vermiconidia calcicola TaxID=1690605 RepID=A0ACC3NRD5_9PEZI|nr:hypothetical protein LTR37_003989 [Vermiconidia calcicola]